MNQQPNMLYVLYHEDNHFVHMQNVVTSDMLENCLLAWQHQAENKLKQKMVDIGLTQDVQFTIRRYTTSDQHVHMILQAQVMQELPHNAKPFERSSYELYDHISYAEAKMYHTDD
jgi:hypothetical protein